MRAETCLSRRAIDIPQPAARHSNLSRQCFRMKPSPVATQPGHAHESRIRLLVSRKVPCWRAGAKKFPLGEFGEFEYNLVFGFSLPEAFLHPVGPRDHPGLQFV